MPEDEVTTQGPPESQRALEVDAIAGLEPAERRARERLGPELEDELVRRALDHRQARTVHGNARADVTALERHARLHAEAERGAGACERDDGPHFLDDPGEHLFKVGGSDAAPPDRPRPPPTGHPWRPHPQIDCAGQAGGSTTSEEARRPLRFLPTPEPDCADGAGARTAVSQC